MAERAEHSQVRFDSTDVRFGPALAVIIGLAISLLLAGGGARWLWHRHNAHRQHGAGTPARTSFVLPAEPRLEPLALHSPEPGPSFLARQQAQEIALRSFGKTDDEQFVHVPIEMAVEQLAKELLSAEPARRSDKSNGLVNGGEGNSGRLLRKAAP